MRRQAILARRGAGKREPTEIGKKIRSELKRQEKLRCLEILAFMLKLSPFNSLSVVCDSPLMNKVSL